MLVTTLIYAYPQKMLIMVIESLLIIMDTLDKPQGRGVQAENGNGIAFCKISLSSKVR